MQNTIRFLAILSLIVILSPYAFATNGDNLIAVGPMSRSMGGALALQDRWMPSGLFSPIRPPCVSATTVRLRNLIFPEPFLCPMWMRK